MAPESAGVDVPAAEAPLAGAEDDAHSAARRRWTTLAVGVVLLSLAVVLPLLRQQGLRSWETLWAEDGTIFYQQAADDGAWKVLLRSFQHYLQLSPRLLSIPATVIPVDLLAVYMAVTSAVVNALLAWFAYYASRGWITSKPVRLAVSSLVVLMPAAGFENTASVTNTIWTFVAVAPWAIVSLRERNVDVVLRSIVLFLAATATAFSLVFAPLAIAWWIWRRTRAAATTAVAFGSGLVIQGVVSLTASGAWTQVPPKRPLEPIVDLVGARSSLLYLVGPDGMRRLLEDHGRLSWVLGAILLVVLLGVACTRAPRRAQVLALVFFAYAVGGFTALVVSRGTPPFADAAGVVDPVVNLRFSVMPTLMTASAFAVVLAPAGAARDRVVARIGRPVLIAHLALVTVLSFTVTSFRGEGRPWQVRVDEARTRCDASPAEETVPINLDRLGLTRIVVSCADLRS